MIASDQRQSNWTTRAKRTASILKSREFLPQTIHAAKEVAMGLRHSSGQELHKHSSQLQRFSAGAQNRHGTPLLAMVCGTVHEAVRRVTELEMFDVQLQAGAAVSVGAIAEMQTGEGKTLALAIPAYYHGLTGSGVHVVTPNQYLAERDFQLLNPVFKLLGMSVGLLMEETSSEEKKRAYHADITYGASHAFGFDYLRDQLTLGKMDASRLGGNMYRRILGRGPEKELLQRGLHVAIIDEADHVLVDDAVSPLILSEIESEQQSPDARTHLAALAMSHALQQNKDFVLVEQTAVHLTREGYRTVYRDDSFAMYPGLVRPWHEYVTLALRAEHCYQRDTHYVVSEDRVRIVDSSTGRIFASRNWSDGLHQAIESKEGMKVSCESNSLARITRQRFYRKYERICGITGTAQGCEKELATNYGTPVVRISTRKPSLRVHWPTHFSETQQQKRDAIAAETQACINGQRAVLIGTPSIAESRALSQSLEKQGIAHRLLNGIQNVAEADVVAAAGQAVAVTVATNMAGRGTDIKLDDRVASHGGLHVIVTHMHPLARVDRQLIGRCARCGDPGTVRFYVSADDPLTSQIAPWIGRAIKRIPASGGAAAFAIRDYLSKAQKKQERLGASLRWRMLQVDRDTERLLEKNVTPRRCFSLVG